MSELPRYQLHAYKDYDELVTYTIKKYNMKSYTRYPEVNSSMNFWMSFG